MNLGVALYAQNIKWVMSSQQEKFVDLAAPKLEKAGNGFDVEVHLDRAEQTIEGFGGCFNELGWAALSHLSNKDRQDVLKELFKPGVGADFTICRMPLGANDFSLGWYSYDETDGDFAMDHFTIQNDLQTLVPFIKGAQKYNKRLKIWASPWSPPQWMKYNHHYAEAMFEAGSSFQNGLQPDQVGAPGQNMFIQKDKYFAAYALYLQKFIQAYRKQGIAISMVMPQNEFMSAQVFPSCTWNTTGLAKFISYLGPAMEKEHVKVFFGTMNSDNPLIADSILNNPQINKYISGAGFQWAGKGAVGQIHQQYPELTLYQSEQECGNGKNDWEYCRYCWDLMKKYLNNGTNAYMYWNIALPKDGISHWGWRQNSLVSVDSASGSYTFNNEYYLLKHVSHFVKPGARHLALSGPYQNMLAFRNPDKSIVLVVQNESNNKKNVRIKIGDRMIAPDLPADSFDTFFIP